MKIYFYTGQVSPKRNVFQLFSEMKIKILSDLKSLVKISLETKNPEMNMGLTQIIISAPSRYVGKRKTGGAKLLR